jgi:hypothetical protein
MKSWMTCTMQNSRAKFVQNFFEFYRILSDSQKMKNDCKRSRIKASTIFDRELSDTNDADGGSRTHTGGYPTRF